MPPSKKKPKRSSKPKREVVEAEVIEGPETTALVRRGDVQISQARDPEQLSADLLAFVVGTLSPNTQKAYAQDATAFGQWWGTTSPIVDLIGLAHAGQARVVVLRYQAALVKQGLAKATVGRRIRALNSIVKKLHFAGQVDWKLDIPVDKIEALKDVRGPGQSQWKKLLQGIEKDDRWFGLRDLAMVRLMGNDNLRAGELGTLRRKEDLRTHEGRLEIFIHGKGQKNQWHPVHPKSGAALGSWLEFRDGYLKEERLTKEVPWIFFSQRHGQLSGKRIWERVVQRAKEVGIEKLHPHALRHHAITQKAKAWKGPQAALTRWARHSDANMTQRYIDDVKDEVYEISQLTED